MTGNPLRYLILPISVRRIFSGYESFADPLIGSISLNRRGLHVWRVRMAHEIANWRRNASKIGAFRIANSSQTGIEEQHSAWSDWSA